MTNILSQPLTERHIRILEHLKDGKQAKEIAALTGLSKKRVEKHISTLHRKFNCSNTTHLVVICIRLGIIAL